jgi:hypothetical protein
MMPNGKHENSNRLLPAVRSTSTIRREGTHRYHTSGGSQSWIHSPSIYTTISIAVLDKTTDDIMTTDCQHIPIHQTSSSNPTKPFRFLTHSLQHLFKFKMSVPTPISFVPQTLSRYSWANPSPTTVQPQRCYNPPPQTPSPTSPIMMNMNHPRRYDQRNVDIDDQTDASPLQCGSIRPDPNYNPAFDPHNVLCVPPAEITIRIKTQVPDWLRLDRSAAPRSSLARPVLDRRRSAPPTKCAVSSRPTTLTRQVSCQSRLQSPELQMVPVHGNPVALSPRRHGKSLSGSGSINPNSSVGSLVGQPSSLHTSPTESSSGDELSSQGRLEIVPGRKSLLRTELQHWMGRWPLFRHRRPKNVDLKRARGCLT